MTRIGGPPAVVDGGRALPAVSLAMLDLQVHPSIATGRRRARFAATVTNIGTAPVQAQVSFACANGALRAEVPAPAVLLGPGERRSAEIVLRPRRPQLLRREVQHTVSVRARGELAHDAVVRDVVFLQGRAFSLVALAVAVLVLAAAGAGVSLLPERVTVPTVKGAPDAATAERALRAQGLRLDPRLRSRTEDGIRPGTILDQIPDPGTRVDRGEQVALLVAVGAERSVTPVLDGQTPSRAAAILAAAGLTAGPVLPAGAGGSSVVASQLPAAGARVPTGTAVTTFVRPARAGDPRLPAAPAAPAVSGEPPTVPQIEGRGVSEYATAVAAAGLVPKVIRTVDRAPPGTLVGVRPRPGVLARPGERVRLLVSAGVPRLAYDTGGVVRVFDPASGRTVREASPPQGLAVEPSWSADGRRVLYRVGKRLSLVSARSADRGRVVYEGSTKYASASLAPAPAGVVALVRRTGGDGDLCFARIGASQLRPRCAADRRWDLGRQIAWAPGGRELLVFGVRRAKPGTFGMLRYRSSHPFSSNPAHWRGAIATDTSVDGEGVIAAAYAPSGTRVALVTNSGRPRFQLALTGAGDLRDPTAAVLPVRACEVAFRPDGNEVAVVQSDDECSRPVGQVVRVDLKAPRSPQTVSSGGRHPAYQPLQYAGPKGAS